MNNLLQSQDQAADKLARIALSHSSLLLEVQEDKCFDKDQWLSLGRIELFPDTSTVYLEEDGSSLDKTLRQWKRAIKHGQFLWHVPDTQALFGSLQTAMSGQAEKCSQAIEEAVQDITRRSGLILPIFDPDVLRDLPFLRPVTIVADTSAVLQGGLDFVVRFLYPMARIKVPIVVSLEIRNMADRFFAIRRKFSPSKSAQCLREHIKSQAGDRALMRLEFSDVEIERRVQNTDPFRMIFSQDNETEVKDLNLSQVQRSFADRLIIESAKEYLSQISPGQPLYVLTSDQGMARTAVTEGLLPMHFEARKAAIPLGRTLSGTLFHPFQSTLYTVSLIELLWEAATCFGSARLRVEDDSAELRGIALGEDIIWFPYQSKENLLWCLYRNGNVALRQSDSIPSPDGKQTSQLEVSVPETFVSMEQKDKDEDQPLQSLPTKTVHTVAYVISVSKLLVIVKALAEHAKLTGEQAITTLSLTLRSFRRYRRFLYSGGFITYSDHDMEATPELGILWKFLLNKNLPSLRVSLQRLPSFQAFLDYVSYNGNKPNWTTDCFTEEIKATNTYRSLAEISASALVIPNEGIFATLNEPELLAFVTLAMETYQTFSPSDVGVLTGEWLEALARSHGIHPTLARQRVEEASAALLWKRSYSGATPPHGYDNHTLDVLEIDQGSPTIRRYNLYTGNFMLTERASVYTRLERIQP